MPFTFLTPPEILFGHDESAKTLDVARRFGSRLFLVTGGRSFEALSERARRRLVVEHDERCFDVSDVLELHRRTGVRVVFDLHHHRCKPAAGWEVGPALAAALDTWPAGVRR